MFRPFPVFIGSRYTRARRRSHFISFISLTSIIGLALGVLVMILVLSVMNGFDREMQQKVLGMVPHATLEAYQPLGNWHELSTELSARPEVAAVAPFIQRGVTQAGVDSVMAPHARRAEAWSRLATELPAELQWFDSRDEIFPEPLPENVRAEHSDPVQAAVQDLAPGARVLIMSFSHAEDLDIVAACLQRRRERGDLPFIGLIGSKSKWATFRHRLEARGFAAEELAGVSCPIGVPGISGKQPAVIAVAVAAQLLQGWGA